MEPQSLRVNFVQNRHSKVVAAMNGHITVKMHSGCVFHCVFLKEINKRESKVSGSLSSPKHPLAGNTKKTQILYISKAHWNVIAASHIVTSFVANATQDIVMGNDLLMSLTCETANYIDTRLHVRTYIEYFFPP